MCVISNFVGTMRLLFMHLAPWIKRGVGQMVNLKLQEKQRFQKLLEAKAAVPLIGMLVGSRTCRECIILIITIKHKFSDFHMLHIKILNQPKEDYMKALLSITTGRYYCRQVTVIRRQKCHLQIHTDEDNLKSWRVCFATD